MICSSRGRAPYSMVGWGTQSTGVQHLNPILRQRVGSREYAVFFRGANSHCDNGSQPPRLAGQLYVESKSTPTESTPCLKQCRNGSNRRRIRSPSSMFVRQGPLESPSHFWGRILESSWHRPACRDRLLRGIYPTTAVSDRPPGHSLSEVLGRACLYFCDWGL